jgi:hypothetical protein
MRLDEFYRRQVERFSSFAEQCPDPKIRADVLALAEDYRQLLSGKPANTPKAA